MHVATMYQNVHTHLNRCITTCYFKRHIPWPHHPVPPRLVGTLPVGWLGGALQVDQEKKASVLPQDTVGERRGARVRSTGRPDLRVVDTTNTTHPTTAIYIAWKNN